MSGFFATNIIAMLDLIQLARVVHLTGILIICSYNSAVTWILPAGILSAPLCLCCSSSARDNYPDVLGFSENISILMLIGTEHAFVSLSFFSFIKVVGTNSFKVPLNSSIASATVGVLYFDLSGKYSIIYYS